MTALPTAQAKVAQALKIYRRIGTAESADVAAEIVTRRPSQASRKEVMSADACSATLASLSF
jgi:hypothetical protein